MVFIYLLKAIYAQKTSKFFFQLCRRFAISFDSCTDLLLNTAAHTIKLRMHARRFLSTQEARIALDYRFEQLLRF